MHVRDRIKEFRRVPASQLRPNPKNWRGHPENQKNALRGVLAEIGIADAVLARELPDGTLMLLDGHARAEVAPDVEWPVLILDVNEEEGDKLLATFDPLTNMAETDKEKLEALLSGFTVENAAVSEMLAGLLEKDAVEEPKEKPEKNIEIEEKFELMVSCQNELEQRTLYEELIAAGHQVRVLTM